MKLVSYTFIILFIAISLFFPPFVPANADTPVYPPGYYKDDPLPDKTVYLTFDDGPSKWTDEILDVLRKENVRATFFICGDWAPRSTRRNNEFKRYRKTLIRMINEGHALGNHTADHRNLARLTPEKIAMELDDNQKLLDRELGKNSVRLTLIRPPFGSPWQAEKSDAERKKVSEIVKTRGVVIMWSDHFYSGDSNKWVKGDWYRNAPRVNPSHPEFKKMMRTIYDKIIPRIDGRGAVILMHDTHLTTAKILPSIIEKLKREGYKFETAEDLVKWRWKKGSAEVINRKM